MKFGVIDEMFISGEGGLTDREVETSRAKHGSNALTAKKRDTFFKKYLQSFGDPMIRVLLVALCINVIVMIRSLDWYEPLGIALSITIATLISTLSEWGSESAFEKLQADAARVNCRVRRGGCVKEISMEQVVVGDRVLLQTGDMIPADGVIASGRISVDQSALNGESKEKEKFCTGEKSAGDFASNSEVFRGSVVCQGEGEMTAAAVGGATFYGHMARDIQQDTRKSPMHIRMAHLAKIISRMGYTGAILVGAAYIFQVFWVDFGGSLPAFAGYYKNFPVLISDIMNLITLIVTVIVVAVPEGLPMMITVVLSANIRKMLKDNVLVRKMTGIETAGSMNILFTDKTGTLTRGKLSVHHVLTGSGRAIDDPLKLRSHKEYFAEIAQGCALNNSASLTAEKGRTRAVGGNATDRALFDFVKGDEPLWRGAKVASRLPFSSERKYSAALLSAPCQGGASNKVLIKGSPDLIIPLCAHYIDENGGRVPSRDFTRLRGAMAGLTAQSARLIALAVTDNQRCISRLTGDLTLVCVLGVRDGLRSETPAVIRQMREAGVQTVMITGDSRETASAIAAECGLLSGQDDIILTSAELGRMTDAHVAEVLPRLRVIARALPSDKSRMVRISQDAGLVVGMTGDGVNDSPALKAADVGFGMGSGTEVAKEASDIVILDDNIKSIGKAVLYGRTIFKSVRKFIIYQLTINLCAVGLSIIGPIIGIDTPITVMQMLWVNLVMDTLAGIAFSGEPPKLSYMAEPPKRRDERILNRYMISSILWMGLCSLGICLLFWVHPRLHGLVRPDDMHVMSAFFALFMFMAIFNSFNARTHSVNLLAYLSQNKPFILIIAAVMAVQTAMLYLGGAMFRTAPLSVTELVRIATLASVVIPLDLARKAFLRRMGKAEGV